MDKNLKENTYSIKEIEATVLDIINTELQEIDNSIVDYWNRYNSTYTNRFDYLTSIGEFDLPVQERNIPLQRRLLNLLIAKKTRRPFDFGVYFDSEDFNKNKFDEKIKLFVDFALDTAERKSMDFENQIVSLNDTIRDIQSAMQQQAQQGAEVAPEDAQALQQLLRQLEMMQQNMQKQRLLSDEMVDEFNVMLKMSPEAILERVATKYLKQLSYDMNFNRMSTNQFENRVVTGHQNYIVVKFDNDKPFIKPIKIQNIVYQKGGPETSINKKDWAYYVERMSFAQIFEDFGEKIVDKYGAKALISLRDLYSPHTNESEMWALPNGGAIFGDNLFNDNSYNFSNDQSIEIKWVWFRGSVPISRKINVDKNGNIHKHILPNKRVINKDDYKYHKGYYIDKKNPSSKYKKTDVSTYSKKSGDKIETRKLNKLYHAIVIDDRYVINIKEWKNIVRDVNLYNRFNLPIFGKSFDSVEEQPYSLIKATNDIQDLLDIVWVSREYMIAVAGTKGNVIDVSQKPDDMTTKEWEYHIKMGRIYIETIDANGVPKRTSFNQWQNFDNSVSQAITYYDSLIENLTQMMGNLIGVPYQALGETTRADQVGTNKMAIQESQMVTEMLFYDHYMIDKEVLEEYMALKIKEADGDDIIFSIPNINGSQEFLLKTKKIIDKNIKLNLYSLGEDTQKIEELKQLTAQMFQNVGMSIGQLIKIWNADTLKEMEARVEYFEEKSKKAASESAKAQKDEQMQTFKEMKQFEAEMEKYVEEVKNKYKEADIMVKQANLQLEKEKSTIAGQLGIMDVQLKKDKNKIDLLKVQQDHATETAMLLYDDKHQTFDDQLRSIELQINTMFRKYELGLETRALGLEGKRINIEDKKVKAESRNKPANSSYSKNND